MAVDGLKAFGALFIGFGIMVLLFLILYVLFIRRKSKKNEEVEEERFEIDLEPPEYVDGGTTIYDAVKIYPFLLRFFIKSGLKTLNNPVALNAFGKRTTISDAAKKIGKKPKHYLREVNSYIHTHLSSMKPKNHENKKD